MAWTLKLPYTAQSATRRTATTTAKTAPTHVILLMLLLVLGRTAIAANEQQPQNNHHHLFNAQHGSRQENQQQQQPPPAGGYTPLVTPAPSAAGQVDDGTALRDQGFSQQTFYTCLTMPGGGSEHCGWHVPVVKAQNSGGSSSSGTAVPRRPTDTGIVVAVVVGLAGVFALAMT